MYLESLRAVSIVWLSCALGAAQTLVDEDGFLHAAANELDAFATRCFKGGYPQRARELWFEVVNEYDPDDEVARESLGFVRVGSVWSPDPRFTYPSEDRPNAAVARVLNRSWASLAKSLGAGHRDLAAKFDSAGDDARAKYHYGRALRFLPKDPKAAKARGLKSFEGFVGTEADLALLRRSRLMDRAVTRLLAEVPEAERLPDTRTQPILDRAGVSYIGVGSEHFSVWGDWEEVVLIEAAQHAERALAFLNEAFDGFTDFKWRASSPVNIAFFKERDTWAKVCQANASLFQRGALEFVLRNVSGTTIGGGRDRIHLAGTEHQAGVNDRAVRWTTQDFCGLRSDALNEGIGHAVVAMFFGRNLVFTVGREREREQRGTSTGAAKRRQERFRIPDIDVWGDLAVEFAWERTDVPAARLPLIRASSFPDEARIKAWAFCDYLLRRDPALLRELDRTAANAARRNETEVAAAFAERTGLDLATLDADWRRLWTEDTPLLLAITGKKTPLEAVSKAAPEALEEFNRLRREYGQAEVSWSAEYSALCKQHADYLAQNRRARGPIEENTQVPGNRGFSNAGRVFAERALVSTDARRPKDAFERWIDWPGFRDAIVNPQLEQVGLYVDRSILVMEVTRGQDHENSRNVAYPSAGQKDVPHAIPVDELGPEVQAALKRRGHGKAKEVGYPITLHFFRSRFMPKRKSIQCSLRRDGREDVRGFVHIGDGGKVRRTSGDGLVVFYPFEPLQRGTRFTVEWSFVRSDGTTSARRPTEFMTR